MITTGEEMKKNQNKNAKTRRKWDTEHKSELILINWGMAT